MRQSRTSGSVGAAGEQSPAATRLIRRWGARQDADPRCLWIWLICAMLTTLALWIAVWCERCHPVDRSAGGAMSSVRKKWA